MDAAAASCWSWTRLLALLVVVAMLCGWTVAEPGLVHTAPDVSSVSRGGASHGQANVKTAESQATFETVEPYVIKLPTLVPVLQHTPETQNLATESSREYVETKERQPNKGELPKLLNLFPNSTISPVEGESTSTTTSSAEIEPASINIVSSKRDITPVDNVGLGDNVDPALNTNKKESLRSPMPDQLLSLVKRDVADNLTDLDGGPANETDDMLATTPFPAQNLTTRRLEPPRKKPAPNKVSVKKEATNSRAMARGHKIKTLCWLAWIVLVFPWRAEI